MAVDVQQGIFSSQIHDLPTRRFVAERIVKDIGNFIGGLHISKFQKL